MMVSNRFCACSFRSARYVHNSPVSINVFNLAGWTSLKFSLVNNDVIHLVDVGVDPDVLVNNTTYPIDLQALDDADLRCV